MVFFHLFWLPLSVYFLFEYVNFIYFFCFPIGMRLSASHQVLKHFYTRTKAFWDNSSLHNERINFAKTRLKLYGALCLSVWYLYEFVVPPPDIRFDIKLFFSSPFAHYVETKGAGGHRIQEENTYRLFNFTKGELQDQYDPTFIKNS